MHDWEVYDYWGDNKKLKNPHSNVRMSEWTTKDGAVLFVGDMTDKHLLNAYRMFGDENLFKEMVVRLFEAKLKEKNT
jgi:hypothetical protein